jgi:hypothetical protein
MSRDGTVFASRYDQMQIYRVDPRIMTSISAIAQMPATRLPSTTSTPAAMNILPP